MHCTTDISIIERAFTNGSWGPYGKLKLPFESYNFTCRMGPKD